MCGRRFSMEGSELDDLDRHAGSRVICPIIVQRCCWPLALAINDLYPQVPLR